jgi:hypothetical protein
MENLTYSILWVHRNDAVKAAFKLGGVVSARLLWNMDLSGTFNTGELFPLSGVCNLSLAVLPTRQLGVLEPELRVALKPYLYGQGSPYLA